MTYEYAHIKFLEFFVKYEKKLLEINFENDEFSKVDI